VRYVSGLDRVSRGARNERDAETEIVETVTDGAFASDGRTASGRVCEEGTAADGDVDTGFRGRGAEGVGVPVVGPFPDIAVHIVDAPCVWGFLCDGMEFSCGVAVVPAEGVEGDAGAFFA
jgi:hypothetical protein